MILITVAKIASYSMHYIWFSTSLCTMALPASNASANAVSSMSSQV